MLKENMCIIFSVKHADVSHEISMEDGKINSNLLTMVQTIKKTTNNYEISSPPPLTREIWMTQFALSITTINLTADTVWGGTSHPQTLVPTLVPNEITSLCHGLIKSNCVKRLLVL
jgi:hypothetical protein